jgi:small subunit ribosomal protein S3
VAQTVIERINKKVKISIYVSRPGLIIGKKGGELEKIKLGLSSIASSEVVINIVEIKRPEASAQLVADNIAAQLEKLVPYRRAVKKAISSAMRLGVGGIKIACSGRLGGVEIARCEHYKEGRIPLHTLRANIDYGVSTAFTAYGACGIKVWIFRKNVYKTNVFAFDTFLTS